jgi:hypothetical protein
MEYLIPANTKRGRLLFGWFRPFDLALLGSGVLVTFVLLAFVPLESIWMVILVLAPALVTAFLVMPVPYYHNMLTIIIELYDYLTNRQTYRWKGWCWKDGK